MGIKQLSKVLGDYAPKAMKENEIKSYFGRKVAIDASMSLYQFLIAIRGSDGGVMAGEDGEATSHIIGMFYRTIRLLSNEIKPVFVFDGKPPTLKSGELARRRKKAAEAKAELEEAKEIGEKEDAEKMAKRTVRVGKEENEDVKKLLRLMGVPIVEAPCEAEAQCAALARAGVVWAAGTEDMDALTFGTTRLLRHLNFSEAKKMPIIEISIEEVLREMDFTMDMFIDMCILLGCDYCDPIKGIGPKKAVELIKKYKSIDEIIKNLDQKKYPLPEKFPYEEVRELFKHPEVEDPAKFDLKWGEVDAAGLKEFLVTEKGFNEQRVDAGIAKLLKAQKKASEKGVQGRIDSFFSRTNKSDFSKPSAVKRKTETKKEDAKRKAKKRRF